MKTSMLILLMTAFLTLTARAEDGTQCSYWPSRESSWIKYQVFRIGAYWSPTTRQLSVLWRIPDCRVVFVEIMWLQSPAVAPVRYFKEKFIVPGGGQWDGQEIGNIIATTDSGAEYIGEIGNLEGGLVISPPEPKLMLRPCGGEDLQTFHRALDARSGKLRSWVFFTKYRTIKHCTTWGGFNDVVWTSLEEAGYPYGNTISVYNYAFARGIGLVNFWYCAPFTEIPSHPSISHGWEFYAVDWMP